MDPISYLAIGIALDKVGSERAKKEQLKNATIARKQAFSKSKKVAKELNKADRFQAAGEAALNTSSSESASISNTNRANALASKASTIRSNAEVTAEKAQMEEDKKAFSGETGNPRKDRIAKDFLPRTAKKIFDTTKKVVSIAGNKLKDLTGGMFA